MIDIRKQNEALMLKNLHKFFNRLDIPWINLVWEKYYKNGKLPSSIKKGSFWWRDNLKLVVKFRNFAMVSIEDGRSCLFWTDNWTAQNPANTAPELYSFAKNKAISVQSALNIHEFSDLFHLPVSEVALTQMQLMSDNLNDFTLSQNKDKWNYSWGSVFSSSKMYKALMDHPVVHPAFKWIWKCPCQPKHKVFFWLLLKDRLSTRNILRRRGMTLEDYTCVLCNSLVEESLDHLFLHCSFARQCWVLLGINIQPNISFPDAVSVFRAEMQSDYFMVAVILMSWAIWTARNDLIFKGLRPSIQNCKGCFNKEINMVSHRIKPSRQEQFQLWSLNLAGAG